MPHDEVEAEQAYLDHAYRCLAAMRERTARVAAVTDSAAQAVDSAIAQWHLERRLATLDPNLSSLAFGRLDDEAGDTWYVGRRHVEDDRGDPVVVDWRAGVSTPFYRATAVDPMELRRRRRFLMTAQRVDDLFDEVFDDPDSVHAAMHGGIPDPLLAELERARTGEMRDIVATIQAEQDIVIRAPLEQCLVVQGGPGTGKTAVGLHRAAFLLYEHRVLLDEQGVLVIGPNPVFLRYIAQVLPSLGETAVRQSTLDALMAGAAYRVRAFDTDRVAALKGDGRWAAVLARAVRASVRPPDDDLELRTDFGIVRFDAGEVRAAIVEIQARGVPYNVGRTALRAQLQRMAGMIELRGYPSVATAVGKWWPTVSAPALVRRLIGNGAALAEAADGLFTTEEQAALVRKVARRIDDEQWTAAELVLVDEAEALITGAPRSYGHIVVDEAQDLSAMGFRALARRCPARSMTILGDLAQATSVGAQASWDDVMVHLGSPRHADYTELTLGYRVPAPILDFANRLLAVAAPDVRPAESVREIGLDPVLIGAADVASAITDVVRERVGRWTTVGVVVPDEVRDAVDAALVDVPRASADALLVLSPPEAKGLEFDAVVVVEPAAIAGDTAAGARLLYIALTRAVQELVVVHARPLPAALITR